MQIINGCQTANTLRDLLITSDINRTKKSAVERLYKRKFEIKEREKLRNLLENSRVSLKIIFG